MLGEGDTFFSTLCEVTILECSGDRISLVRKGGNTDRQNTASIFKIYYNIHILES